MGKNSCLALKKFRSLGYRKHFDWLETFNSLFHHCPKGCLPSTVSLASTCVLFFWFLLKYSSLVGNILFLKVHIRKVHLLCISLSFLSWFWNNLLSVPSCSTYDSCLFIYFFKVFTVLISLAVLGCRIWDLIPWPGIELRLSALGVQSLGHWVKKLYLLLTERYTLVLLWEVAAQSTL